MTFKIEQSPEIWHRGDFPLLCMWRGLHRCVEVGVDQGVYSEAFFNRHWNLSLYFGVDNYTRFAGSQDRTPDMNQAITRYSLRAGIARLINGESTAVARSLMDDMDHLYKLPYHFVYLDGDHSRAGVTRDLEAWWPLVSDGGMLAGHDWDMVTKDHAGVQEAVVSFAEKHDLTIYHTYEDDPQSWYVYKGAVPFDVTERRVPS